MTDEELQQETVRTSAGKLLKQGREQAGISIDDVAQKLHLRAKNIEDIEADIIDPKVSLTFHKGYLRLYAKHVNVSEQRVLEAFNAEKSAAKEPAKLQSFSRRVSRQANDDRLMLITYLIIAVVVALVVWWWLQQSNILTETFSDVEPQEIEAQPLAEVAEPTNTSTAVNLSGADSQPQSQLDSHLSDTETQVSTPVELAEAEVSPTTNEVIAEQLTDVDDQPLVDEDVVAGIAVRDEVQIPSSDIANAIELVFEFAGDCWMNLTDSTGEAIAYGVKKSGRVMPVSGVPPFEVTLGAPEVVQISYNGEPIDMTNFPAGRTARFRLPLGE